MKIEARAAALLAVVVLAGPAQAGPLEAGRFDVSLAAGARFDGELRDPFDFAPVTLRSGAAFTGALRVGLGDGAALELVWSRATNRLDVSEARSVPSGLELSVTHYQLGLQYELGEARLRPLLGVSAGGAHFIPSAGGAEPATAFGIGGVAGLRLDLTTRLRLLTEVRVFGTFSDRQGGLFCEPRGVCVLNKEGALWQSQLGFGVAFAY